jgi:hypothetical protein
LVIASEEAFSSQPSAISQTKRLKADGWRPRDQFEEAHMLKKTSWNLGTIWCSLMHDSVMWPIHGQYQCRTCGRRYSALPEDPHAETHGSPIERSLFRPALPLLVAVVVASLAHPLQAADARKDVASAEASVVLERYVASSGPGRWAVEALEIDAALPKLGKSGRLQAIRRLVPFGQTKYQVLQLTGDPTVKDQVIVRYLKAEQRAAEIPPVSVAINPANYKIAFRSLAPFENRAAYVFQITPRKKRQGLIKGELWLDAETAVPLRESGYFVKSPSVFIKRVEVIQESVLRDDAVELRLTYLTVNTRIVGRAELVIAERPLNSAEGTQVESCDEVGE